METLIVVAQHQGEFHHSRSSKNHGMGPAQFGAFGSPPTNGFRDISCRTFQSGPGILPTPLQTCSTPVVKQALSHPFSLKTPSPSVNTTTTSLTEPKKHSKRFTSKSSAVPIPISLKQFDSNKEGSKAFGSFGDDFLYSELWAGPAYSNSPPPSSLPIPKFSVVRPKRTVSLELPSVTVSVIDLHPIAKSAPTSPTHRDHNSSPRDVFHSDDSATKTLRRILNLDMTD